MDPTDIIPPTVSTRPRQHSTRTFSESCTSPLKDITTLNRPRTLLKRCRMSVSKLDDLVKKTLAGKKRKRLAPGDGDSISLCSLDFDIKPKKKRASLSRKASTASNSSTGKPSVVEKVSRSFSRSRSFRDLVSFSSLKSADKPFKRTTSTRTTTTPGKLTPSKTRRLSTYWYETADQAKLQELDKCERDRQEAIYELYKGEEDLIADLHMVRNTYQESMKKLGLLSDEDLTQIFGPINELIPLHQCLVSGLVECRQTDGTTESIGQAVLEWIPRLESYVSYCANQVYAKALLDVKRRQPAIEDFLQRCQDSPFSRKLDLWSFLDVPRSKLVKYPLLFRSIQKVTPLEHDDNLYMEKAIQEVNVIIEKVDLETGRAKCQFTKDKLDYIDDDKQEDLLVEESSSVICDGILKTLKGNKLHVFLFDKVLVLTRPVSRGRDLRYLVYRQPIPISELVYHDSETDSPSTSGRPMISSALLDSNLHVIFYHSSTNEAYVLVANDEHDKRQWTQAIRDLIK